MVQIFVQREDVFDMAKKNIAISGLAMGIIAIVAGVLVLAWPGSLYWIVGIFLIVWGILAVIGRR